MRPRGWGVWLLLLPCLGVMLGWMCGVIGLLGRAASVPGDFSAFLGGTMGGILLRTHAMALCVTLASLAIGYPVAVFMARRPRAAGLLLGLLVMPLLTSIVVRTFGWMILLGPKGVVNTALMATGVIAVPLRLMYDSLGVFIGLTHVLFPFAVLAIYPVRAGIDGAALEAGASLGAGPLRQFLFVSLPLTVPGVLNAFAIVYLLAAGAIVTPLMLGGAGSETLGALVYENLFRFFDLPRGAVIAVVLTVSALAVVLPLQAIEARLLRHMVVARA